MTIKLWNKYNALRNLKNLGTRFASSPETRTKGHFFCVERIGFVSTCCMCLYFGLNLCICMCFKLPFFVYLGWCSQVPVFVIVGLYVWSVCISRFVCVNLCICMCLSLMYLHVSLTLFDCVYGWVFVYPCEFLSRFVRVGVSKSQCLYLIVCIAEVLIFLGLYVWINVFVFVSHSLWLCVWVGVCLFQCIS